MKPTLHTKILGGLAFLVALLLLVSFAAYRSTGHLADAASQSQRSQEILTRLESLMSTMTDAETGQRGYSITGNEAFLEPYRQATRKVDAEFAALRDLVTDPAQQKRLAALPSLLTRRMAWLHDVVEARRTLGLTAAQRLVASGRGKALHDEIRQVIAGLIQAENELLQEREERTRASVGTSQTVIVASGLGVFMLAMLMLVILNRGFAANARARKSLTAANSWQQAILYSANQSIIATNAHGIVQTFNRAAERMLGYAAADVIGKPAPPLHDAEEIRRRAAELSQELGRSIAPGTEVFAAKPRLGAAEEREWTYIRKDGSRFPVLLSVSAMRDADGQLAGFMGIGTDLSERRGEEERFRQVVEAAPNGFAMLDRSGRITLVNAQMEKSFGYPRAELIGQPIEKLLPERLRKRHEAHRTNFFADPSVRAMGAGRDLFGLHQDGREVPVEIGLNPISIGDDRFVLASIIDVSARKQAEDALRQVLAELEQRVRERTADFEASNLALRDSEQRIGLATEATEVGIWEWNVIDDKIRWNRQMFRIYGIAPTPDGFVDYSDWSGTVLTEDLPRQEEILQDTVRRLGRSQREFRIRRRGDGETRLVEAVEVVRANAQGQAEWVVGTNLDITERRQAELALRRSHDELEEKVIARTIELNAAKERAESADRIKSAFLATMSHELRTPLNSIIGFTGILRQGLAGPLNPEQDKQLGMVQGSARHLLALINDVLDISRIEAGELRIDPRPFDLRRSIDKVVGIVRPLAEKKSLALNFRLEPELGQAVSDERRFEQILLDIQLPGMDGYAVARALKSDPRTQPIPIVAVTSYAMAADREKALASGAEGYIEKPIDPETFVSEIEIFLKPAATGPAP